MSDPKKPSALVAGLPIGMGLGLALGVSFALAIGNMAFLGIGLPFGLLLAPVFGEAMLKRKQTSDDDEQKS